VPERPRLALRIGVTGHRTQRLADLAAASGTDVAAYQQRLSEILESVLQAIETACLRCAALPDLPFADDAPLISVLTGAAFGVDRLAVALVAEKLAPADTAAQWRIETVLPAPITLAAEAAWEDYASQRPLPSNVDLRPAYAAVWQEFLAQCHSVTILPATWRPDDRASQRPRIAPLDHVPPFMPAERIEGDYRLSYVAAANFQLQQADILIAVWDGKPPRGPGGVADILTRAHAARKPVILIDASDLDRPPVMLRSIESGPDHSNIVGWSPAILGAVTEAADCRDAAIGDAVLSLLTLHRAPSEKDREHGHPALTIDDFLAEGAKRRKPSHVYAHFVRLLGGGRRARPGAGRHDGSRSDASWTAWADALRGQTGLSLDLQTILRGRYAAASALANVYASRYRSTFVAAFIFGAMAGGVAVVGQEIRLDGMWWPKAALIGCELLAITAVMLLIQTGRRRKYHAKYVEYRTLAESLYSLRFLSPFGLHPPTRLVAADSWSDWYVESTARELGLPNLDLGPNYQRRLLKVVCEQEIKPQIAYHEQSAHLMRRVEHRIHLLGNFLFFSVFSALALMLAIWTGKGEPFPGVQAMESAGPFLTCIAAFFPTVGAALAGIRFMADFDGRAVRSRDMADALRDLGRRAAEGEEVQDFATTVGILRDLAATLSEDVKYFHAIYSRRELTLPG